MPHEETQWFNYNLPKEHWTKECPPDLQDCSEKDRGIIGSYDTDFEPMSWGQVKHLIGMYFKLRVMVRTIADHFASN
jgi:hypothetical protein